MTENAMSLGSRLKAWDPGSSGRFYTSRGIRRWRTQSLLAVPGAIWVLVGMPDVGGAYWLLPIILVCVLMVFILLFHPIASPIAVRGDELEGELMTTASADTMTVLIMGGGIATLYSILAGFGVFPKIEFTASPSDIAFGMLATVYSIRSVLMSFRVSPLDEEGDPAEPVSPVSLPTILIGAAVLMVTALFAASAVTKPPSDLAALSEMARESCGRGNVKSVSVAPEDFGYTCKTDVSESSEAP